MHYGRQWSLPPSFYSICTSPWGDLPAAAQTFMSTELQPCHSLLSKPSRKGMPLALGLGTQWEMFHWLDPEWQPHSVSHLPYLKAMNCWTGFALTNILLTLAAWAESFSSLIQTSTLLEYLGNYPILSLNLRSWGIRDRNHRFWGWPGERSFMKGRKEAQAVSP